VSGGRAVRGVPGRDFGVEDVRGAFPEEIEVQTVGGPVSGEVRVPGSKSITNRALLVAALADGASVVENPLFSDDSYWLMAALAELGFEVRADRAAGRVEIGGLGGEIPAREAELFVGNAGTVARFMPPFLALGGGMYVVDGVARMRERPIGDLVGAMRALGARVGYAGDEGRFPLRVAGGGLRGGSVRVDASKSSQFVSGLLIAAPYARGPVEVVAEGRKDWPYVALTAGVMRAFGVEVAADGATYRVPLGTYRPRRPYAVEPDASGASYFFAAAALTGGRVRVPGLGRASSQGDLRFLEVLSEMGCAVEVGEDAVEVRGPEDGRLRGVSVRMSDFSDTMMTLAVLAPFAEGPTTISGVAHTRHQESDRVGAVAAELSRLGVRVEESEDGLRIQPGPVRPREPVETYDDHRMAMAFALVGLAVPGVRVKNPACVAKTLPGYFELLRDLADTAR